MMLLRAGRAVRVRLYVPATSAAAQLQPGPRGLFSAQPQPDSPEHDAGEPGLAAAEACTSSQATCEHTSTTSSAGTAGVLPAAAAAPPWQVLDGGGRVVVDPVVLPDVMDELPPEEGALADALQQLDLGPGAAGLDRVERKKVRRAAAAQLATQRTSAEVLKRLRGEVKAPGVLLQDGEHGITDEGLSRTAWEVLLRLRAAGHDVYLVGGSVRDLLLGIPAKDTDVLTTASCQQVRSLFRRSKIIGRLFPICHVEAGSATLEVSSFATSAGGQALPPDAAARAGSLGLSSHSRARSGRESHRRRDAPAPSDADVHAAAAAQTNAGAEGALVVPSWTAARRDNAIQRDFTVNGLLFDPFSRALYDYVGGVADCRRRVLRCVGDAPTSFRLDPARMLRALRLASRTGLRLEPATRRALTQHADLLADLNPSRAQLELHSMMAYGSAGPALELLWSTDVMPVVLPHIHAAIVALGAPRIWTSRGGEESAKKSRRTPPIAYRLLKGLDAQASPSRPLSPVSWATALLAQVAAQRCRELAGEARWRGTSGAARGRIRGQRAALDVENGHGNADVAGASSITADKLLDPPPSDDAAERAWIRAAVHAVAAARDELAVPCAVPGTLPCFPVGRAMLDAAERTLLHELSTRVEPGVGLTAKLRLARRDAGRAEPLLRMLRSPEYGWIQATSPPWHAAGKWMPGAAAVESATHLAESEDSAASPPAYVDEPGAAVAM